MVVNCLFRSSKFGVNLNLTLIFRTFFSWSNQVFSTKLFFNHSKILTTIWLIILIDLFCFDCYLKLWYEALIEFCWQWFVYCLHLYEKVSFEFHHCVQHSILRAHLLHTKQLMQHKVKWKTINNLWSAASFFVTCRRVALQQKPLMCHDHDQRI